MYMCVCVEVVSIQVHGIVQNDWFRTKGNCYDLLSVLNLKVWALSMCSMYTVGSPFLLVYVRNN